MADHQCVPFVITLVSAAKLDAKTLKTARQIIEVTGGLDFQKPHWLSPSKAVDIYCQLAPKQSLPLTEQLRQNLGNVDLVVQRAANRRKKLLVADMDATIIEGESIDALAKKAGVGAQVAAITEQAMQGRLDFTAALIKRVSALRGLPFTAIEEYLSEYRLNAGARELVATTNLSGAQTMLLSGGFDCIVRPISKKLGFKTLHCNHLTLDYENKVAGTIRLPVMNAQRKLDMLEAEAKTLGLEPRQTLAIGDGANDIPMIRAAGMGIAYKAKEALRKQTPYQINHSDLLSVLFFQGFTQKEIVKRG